MRNRRSMVLLPLLVLALAATCLSGGTIAAKSQVKVKIKISAEFPDFPLPFSATLVAKGKQKASKEWTEYRVMGMSITSLTTFYRTNMPGHGWKLRVAKGNTWTWTRGNRTIVVVYFRLSSLISLIQVRETRR